MSTVSTEIALPPQVERQTTDIVKQAQDIVISTSGDYLVAGELLRTIKTIRDNIAATFDAPIRAAHAAHKSVLDAKNKHESPLRLAEATIKGRMSDWTTEQERQRRAEEARLREVARKEEEERRLAEAAELEKHGENEAAEALVSAPVIAPTVVVPRAVPKVEGVSTRRSWKYRIVNAHQIPREYMTPDEKKIGGVVRSLGEAANIPGVEVYPEDVISGRGF